MQKGKIGGILAIVASALGLLAVVPMIFYPFMMDSVFDSVGLDMGSASDIEIIESMTSFIGAVFIIVFIIFLLIGTLGILGGIFAMRRRIWGLALAGAIASSVLFYPVGIVSVILVSMGYEEFKKPEPRPAAITSASTETA